MTEPWDVRSKTKQEEFNIEANERTILFLRDTLLPQIAEELSDIIGEKAKLSINKDDPQTIIINYPQVAEFKMRFYPTLLARCRMYSANKRELSSVTKHYHLTTYLPKLTSESYLIQ